VIIAGSARIHAYPFGTTREGRAVQRFTLVGAQGLELEVLEYGGVIRSLRAPDRWGHAADVVLGYDALESYEDDRFYLGAVVGRSAGRIRGGRFTLDGERIELPVNDGEHHLHGGVRGFGKAVWRGTPFVDGETPGVTLEYLSPDGEEGYPGSLAVRITYTITPSNVLAIDYRAQTDRPTPVNLTQHSYLNLAGEGAGDVLGQELTVHADRFAPLGADLIPTGELAPVAGTPLDFRSLRRVGAGIDAPHEQLRIAGGYDHTYALRRTEAGLSPAALLADPASGRVLEVFTTEPAMQLYSANFLDASVVGKQGHPYGPRAGLCLETQHFPDSPNQPAFPSTILRPGEVLRSRTELRFSRQPGPGARE
jgi:aldose 1-epimerase